MNAWNLGTEDTDITKWPLGELPVTNGRVAVLCVERGWRAISRMLRIAKGPPVFAETIAQSARSESRTSNVLLVSQFTYSTMNGFLRGTT